MDKHIERTVAYLLHCPRSTVLEVMRAWNAQPVLAGETIGEGEQRLVELWRREIADAFHGCSSEFVTRRPLRPEAVQRATG